MTEKDYQKLIEMAFDEDLETLGDVTSRAIFDDQPCRAALIAKDSGILAGSQVFADVYRYFDKDVQVEFYFHEGDSLKPGDKVADISGKALSILSCERISLNFLSFTSGIASKANELVLAARQGGSAVILDTRKTLPGFRVLSKYAVKIGGAQNHRMGLFDMVMIKDNHIDACGSISRAVDAVKKKWGARFDIEVECRNLEEVQEALDCGVQVVMLDNMDNATMANAVKLVKGRAKTEASGNMALHQLREVSALGVDYISVGMVTKSVKAFDFSLEVLL
ncbi:MAG: carboxylating nicotinate-nucleotide diphosphorylase [Spirochaetales bacterium]|nr:carboxylating nicotinate-nucleotide diphosphorylase [Spirochaetales bacterium]